MPELGEVQQIGNDLFAIEFLHVPADRDPRGRGFWIARSDVSQRQYADFVKFNPEWQQAAVLPSMADTEYLSQWEGEEPEFVEYHNPIVYVSFFAAQAFSEYAGVRLPKIEEWRCAAECLTDFGFERGSADGKTVGNWTASVGRGDRRLVAGIESDPDGYKRTVVSGLWGFRCAADG